ncbi:MAG: adenosylhomocysteinase, partial [bacterium]|nr:adenosylhomocysteinase [bacterium]
MSTLELDLTLRSKIAENPDAEWGLKEMKLSENEMPGLM